MVLRRWLCAVGALLTLTGCQDTPDWNVVLVTWDTTRPDRLGTYGAERARTPHLDALAAEGTRFERAYTSVPITAPAHSTILTGKYPLAHGVRDNGLFVLGDEQETLAEILRAAGLRTAAAVGSFPLAAQFGLDQGFELYDDHFDDRFGFEDQSDKPSIYFSERPAELVNESVDGWLDEVADERFFLWLHYYDPHQPFQPPPPYDELFLDDPYAGEIAYSDEALGSVIDRLRELGVYDRTLLVFASDHGEGLGEHNEDTHSMLLYDATLRVPLIIRAPDAPTGQIVEQPVGTVDIVPTVLELLGLPPLEAAQGRSLADAVLGGELPKSDVLYAETLSPRLAHGWGELRALLGGGYKYVHGPLPELFDKTNDPAELRNLVSQEPELTERMRQQLSGFIAANAAKQQSAAAIPDEATRQKLMALGYLSSTAGAESEIVEALRSDGVPPQERVRDVNAMTRGKFMLFEGRPLQAEEIFRGLLTESPDSPIYNEMLAMALLQTGRLTEAREVLESLGGRDGGASEKLWSQLAFIYLTQGDLQAALEVSAHAIERAESAPVLFVRAGALRGAGELEAAQEALERALELDPTHLPARVDLALRFAELGEVDRAAVEFERALEIYPYAPRAHYNYARLLLDQQEFVRAERHFERAVRLDAAYLKAHYALVALRYALGDDEGALEALSRLEEQGGGSEEAMRAAQLVKGSR